MKAQALALLALTPFAAADQISIPHPPQANTQAKAAEMKANFDVLVAESNENDSRITNVESEVAEFTNGYEPSNASYSWYRGSAKLGSRATNVLVPDLFVTSTGYYGTVDDLMQIGQIWWADANCSGTKYVLKPYWYELAGNPPFIGEAAVGEVESPGSDSALFMHNASTTGTLNPSVPVYKVRTTYPYPCIQWPNDDSFFVEVIPLDPTTTDWQWSVDELPTGNKMLVADD